MAYPLPYAFARGAQLLLEAEGEQLVLWHGPAPQPGPLSEVLRKYPVQRLQLAHRVFAHHFGQGRPIGRRAVPQHQLLAVVLQQQLGGARKGVGLSLIHI